MDKVVAPAQDAVADVFAGATIAVGGFGLRGIPSELIEAVVATGADDLEVISNNCGTDESGLGRLLENGRIRRVVASYVGDNQELVRRYLTGHLELELTPQRTLAERMRAGGCGIPGFFTATPAGTEVADGGLPWRYDARGRVVKTSPLKPVQVFETREGEREFVLEEAIVADFGLVRAWKGDRHGNLVYRDSARNFNPLVAMCALVTVAEVEELVEPGELDPNEIHTPGAYVERIVALDPRQSARKAIQRLRTAPPAAELFDAEGTSFGMPTGGRRLRALLGEEPAR